MVLISNGYGHFDFAFQCVAIIPSHIVRVQKMAPTGICWVFLRCVLVVLLPAVSYCARNTCVCITPHATRQASFGVCANMFSITEENQTAKHPMPAPFLG